MKDIPEITWFDESEKSDKDLDALTLHRFNIKNFTEVTNHKLDNYYVFKINDPDKESKTGFYGMCIQKEFAKQVKNNLEAWKKMKK